MSNEYTSNTLILYYVWSNFWSLFLIIIRFFDSMISSHSSDFLSDGWAAFSNPYQEEEQCSRCLKIIQGCYIHYQSQLMESFQGLNCMSLKNLMVWQNLNQTWPTWEGNSRGKNKITSNLKENRKLILKYHFTSKEESHWVFMMEESHKNI